jgi:hypothetical protein
LTFGSLVSICLVAKVGLLDQTRFLTELVPRLIFLLAAGIQRAGQIVESPRLPFGTAVNALCAATAVFFVVTTAQHFSRTGLLGFAPVAHALVAEHPKGAIFLVSSDTLGEGAFISEVAVNDSCRPAQIVLRASKLLTDSSWTGRDRRIRFISKRCLPT